MISLGRVKVQPFSARQIEVVSTFADQAMIAIENVGLFKQVQARTRRVQSSLDYQTLALSGVLTCSAARLRRWSRSSIPLRKQPGGLCDCHDAVILLRDGELLRPVANCGPIGFNPTERPVGSDWIS